MASSDLCQLSAQEMAAAVRTRQVSPVELIDAVLAAVERLNPAINAFCLLLPEQARAAAREAEAAVLRGDTLPPLHGVPLSVKDNVFTRGIRTARGSALFADAVPDFDAPV